MAKLKIKNLCKINLIKLIKNILKLKIKVVCWACRLVCGCVGERVGERAGEHAGECVGELAG
jgi:hypothetical protein